MPRKEPAPMTDDHYAGMRHALLHIELCLTTTERMIRDPANRDIRDRLRGELEGYTAGRNVVERMVRREQERRQEAIAHG